MTPDIPKIDPDRHLDPRVAAWYFRDEVLRRLFHLHSVARFGATDLIPFFGKFTTSSLRLAAFATAGACDAE
jgi:hypothetical protein